MTPNPLRIPSCVPNNAETPRSQPRRRAPVAPRGKATSAAGVAADRRPGRRAAAARRATRAGRGLLLALALTPVLALAAPAAPSAPPPPAAPAPAEEGGYGLLPPPSGMSAAAPGPAAPRAPDPTAADLERAASLLAQSAVLEAAGELPAALRLAQQARDLGGGVAAAVRAGWLLLQTGDRPAARTAYTEALALDPQHADAALGLTLVLALEEAWNSLGLAAAELTRRHPGIVWGWLRLGLAKAALGDLPAARTAYAEALRLEPGGPDALVGLALVAEKAGDVGEAERQCAAAAERLQADDARLAGCRRLAERKLVIRPSVWGAYAGYVRYYTLKSVWSVAAETEAAWAAGPNLVVGFAFARTDLRFSRPHFDQYLPVVAFGWVRPAWRVQGSYLASLQRGPGHQTEHVLDLNGGGQFGPWGFAAELASSIAPAGSLVQGTATLAWTNAGGRLTLFVRPHANGWLTGADGLAGTVHASVALGFQATLSPRVVLDGNGWYGRRRNFIEGQGRWDWNTPDVFTGGYQLGVDLQAAAPLHIVLRARHDFGIEQSGRAETFHLLTGQLGLVFEW